MNDTLTVPHGVDPTRPSAARLYDYYLGGTTNYAIDRETAEKLKAAAPDLIDAVWANRGFHGRAAVWLAEQGIRQFIDIGSGLPTQNNTHEAVHKVAPEARVVYVDNDPMVAAHAGALLADDGTTTVVTADLREPDALLSQPALVQLIDFAQPVGLLMTSVIHFVPDELDPWGLVARYMAEVAPGSYLVLSHATYDNMPPRAVEASVDTYAKTADPVYLRPRAAVERFFDGLELVAPYTGADPEVTYVGLWGAEDPGAADTDGSRGYYCGVARRAAGGAAVTAKPTVAGLGIDVGAQNWQRSGDGDGALEIAFVGGTGGADTEWVLMRVAGDPDGHVLVYDRNEWECFLDGVRGGEFDDAAG